MTIIFVLLVLGFTVSGLRFFCSFADWLSYLRTRKFCDDELWLGDTSIEWNALFLMAAFGGAAYFAHFWVYPQGCC